MAAPVIEKTCDECGKAFSVAYACIAERRVTCGRVCANRRNWKRRDRLVDKLEAIAAVSAITADVHEQAALLGVSVEDVYRLRFQAKDAGFDVAPAQRSEPVESARLAEIEAEMTEECPRCFLRGPHVCTGAMLVSLVESRMSMWVEPENGTED